MENEERKALIREGQALGTELRRRGRAMTGIKEQLSAEALRQLLIKELAKEVDWLVDQRVKYTRENCLIDAVRADWKAEGFKAALRLVMEIK